MFLHFGMQTFLSTDVVSPAPPVATYQPTGMDPDQWVATAWHAGFRYVVLTVKHHTGFCLWPSQYTSYSVANPDCGNHQDVVGLTAAACRKYGLSFGMYYSLWDLNEPTYRTNFWPGYHAYMTNQLTELLTQYGPICEIWFDGEWGERRNYGDWHMAEVYDCVKRLQPNCAVLVNYGIALLPNLADGTSPGLMTNGSPIICFPYDVRTCDPQLPAFNDPKLYNNVNIPGSLYYLPYESPFTLETYPLKCWFWNATDPGLVDLSNLTNFYAQATANSNAALINVPPTTAGVLPDAQSNLVMQAASALGLTPYMSPNADTDGDGASNWAEWIAGTDPTDPKSVFRMLAPTNTADGLLLSWTSVTNRTYFLELATSLSTSSGFTLLQSNLVGQLGVTSYTVSNSGEGPFFYRVGIQR
jgi:alpha-L-fucosidase